MPINRPILRYHGGKWILADWIIDNFPKHRVYIEPFGGAASVLLQKQRSYCEVYNDLDGEVVNVFSVLRDTVSAARLREMLELTPFARTEFLGAYQLADDPVEAARRTIIKSFMGFGSAAITSRGQVVTDEGLSFKAPTGFRANSKRSGTTPAHDWRSYPAGLPEYVERLRGVVIENRDARAVIEAHDGLETLIYADPPYCPSTRDSGSDYRFEMTDEQHREPATTLHGVHGMVLLSGYPSRLYDEIYGDWEKIERRALGDGARERTEVLWFNPAATAGRKQPTLYDLERNSQCQQTSDF
jgi:DNA adenine methylase